ncbi:GNAT family N-acyltransferase [Myxococcus landrumensis]|uniref:GNAT family N-acetyltransferase n=1 Tax=Myxococcus landrumensis TaxID=2813577 RepID=A0ABX7NEX2_9BACT|nr:GNAT family N-acyltransferase [Myxococcus landrumus]QSQ14828.1 GNAT family N-acetyltransferase [Myxococcus landrumus]
MSFMTCRVATTQRELDDAVRIRWAVFGGELRLLSGTPPVSRREVGCFDTLETTVHLVVYAGADPVATSRLLLPNPDVASAMGGHLGIELDQKLDLGGLGGEGFLIAESTRFCILKRWRHSEAVLRLQSGLYEESRRRGVTHWIASANMETDCAEDARWMVEVASDRGWLTPRWHVRSRGVSHPPEVPRAPFYTEVEREHASQGRLAGLRMPPVLSLFARKMGARFMGAPHYDEDFRRFSLPLVAALDDVPASTLARFANLDAPVPRADQVRTGPSFDLNP